ncbi:hypothetical protein MRB53_007278 [Persea americana]|uniref:Uncharacterized protein n=1 Tax=Persea americana TaxID=3435 RepID=A0ACC2MJE2_PERAE|nr:hypothetical protein MRB53_007278 [Persea americana]
MVGILFSAIAGVAPRHIILHVLIATRHSSKQGVDGMNIDLDDGSDLDNSNDCITIALFKQYLGTILGASKEGDGGDDIQETDTLRALHIKLQQQQQLT